MFWFGQFCLSELPKGATTYFLQERGLDSQILGHHVKAEEMAVDPRAGHRETVQVLVLVGCDPE